jgi:Rrf2 family protein
MRLSMSVECAMHGLLYLAIHGEGKPVLLADMARRLGVSQHTFRKAFQSLAGAGIVVAYRGAAGGYTLGRELSQISLRDLIDAVDGIQPVFQCLIQKKRCELGPDCAIECALARALEGVNEALARVNLGEVLQSVKQDKKRLRWARVPVGPGQ